METGRKTRPFPRVYQHRRIPVSVKMSPRRGWRSHFSPNLSTLRIGMVRDLPEKKASLEVVVWIPLAQPTETVNCLVRQPTENSEFVSSIPATPARHSINLR